MPELPEVEAVCRKLRVVEGAGIVQLRIVRAGIVRPQRVAAIERGVSGRVLRAVERRGKNILLWLDNGSALHVHLRMTGNLFVIPDVRLRSKGTRAWMELEGGRGVIYEDSRALGRIHLLRREQVEERLAEVGVEPLSDAFTLEYWLECAQGSRKPSKIFLMDQRYVAGLGNIYVAEALFRAGIHPGRVMSGMKRPKLERLYSSVKEVLVEAMGSAAAAYAEPGRVAEGETFACAVYDREGEPCIACGRKVKRMAQGGRSTYYCGTCQR